MRRKIIVFVAIATVAMLTTVFSSTGLQGNSNFNHHSSYNTQVQPSANQIPNTINGVNQVLNKSFNAWVQTSKMRISSTVKDLNNILIDQAYAVDTANGFIYTEVQNDYLYPNIFIPGLTFVSGWGLHVYVYETGWENALYPLADLGVDSGVVSSLSHLSVTEYGGQYVCVGVYES